MQDVVVRRVRADDGAAYRAIRMRSLADAPLAFSTTLAQAEVRHASWWDERVVACAEGDNAALFVVETSEGMCGLIGGVRAEMAGHVTVTSMWVEPDARHLGLGRQLLDAVAGWARGQGARTLDLWVTDGYTPAIALYEAYGFVFTGEVTPHPSYAGLVEHAMSVPLVR